jgi:Uma2 family endonuclease
MATAAEFTGPVSEILLSSDNAYFTVIDDGQPVERPPMGAEADQIMVILIVMIQAHAAGKIGLCFTGHCGYQIFPDQPNLVRFPDVSFIRNGRLPGNKIPRGYVEVVPDLVVEVVSPNDIAENVERRLIEFLRAGVPLAWMIYPLTKQVYVFHQGPASLRLGEGDILDGEDVLPGFSCPVKSLFALI